MVILYKVKYNNYESQRDACIEVDFTLDSTIPHFQEVNSY